MIIINLFLFFGFHWGNIKINSLFSNLSFLFFLKIILLENILNLLVKQPVSCSIINLEIFNNMVVEKKNIGQPNQSL